MDIKEEVLIAEIERFKEEVMKSYVVSRWAESYTNTDPFGYVILKNENNKVWWLKTQAYQLWEAWLAAKAQAVPEVKLSHCVTLTCAQLREAFLFGAPDEDDQEQLETEMTITWSEDGHSGKGYYCYYSELPEEGAIFLDEVIEAQEQSHE